MKKYPYVNIQKLYEAILASGAKKVTKYVSETFVVKITRRFKPRLNERIEDFVLTIGRPNYEERRFIALCKKAKVKFPLRKIQYRHFPKGKK